MYDNERRPPNSINGELARRRANFFAEWMNKLAAGFREAITLETQALYLERLSTIPLDQLEYAFLTALDRCIHFPRIAEIKEFAAAAPVSQERIEAARARLNVRLEQQGLAPLLKSALDELPPLPGELHKLQSADLSECTLAEKRQWAHLRAQHMGWLPKETVEVTPREPGADDQ